ncbi:hypothetical protein BKA81DRAFT_417491 [Phyllosticta paracitricarpa]|uniref:Uncharacterized protein n=1 Tax=Phyllosticta paracitricarpa TaxID=2016321 RepID=A0ABR1N5V4_9PEZI
MLRPSFTIFPPFASKGSRLSTVYTYVVNHLAIAVNPLFVSWNPLHNHSPQPHSHLLDTTRFTDNDTPGQPFSITTLTTPLLFLRAPPCNVCSPRHSLSSSQLTARRLHSSRPTINKITASGLEWSLSVCPSVHLSVCPSVYLGDDGLDRSTVVGRRRRRRRHGQAQHHQPTRDRKKGQARRYLLPFPPFPSFPLIACLSVCLFVCLSAVTHPLTTTTNQRKESSTTTPTPPDFPFLLSFFPFPLPLSHPTESQKTRSLARSLISLISLAPSTKRTDVCANNEQ